MLPGNYEITETAAPDGYIVNTTAKEFTLSSTNPKVTLDYADKQNETIIVKKDAKTNTILAGATLKVINKDTSEVIDTFVTTTTGHSIKGLKVGKYILEEVKAPEGYVTSNSKIYFDVTSSGEVKTETIKNDILSISINNKKVTVNANKRLFIYYI